VLYVIHPVGAFTNGDARSCSRTRSRESVALNALHSNVCLPLRQDLEQIARVLGAKYQRTPDSLVHRLRQYALEKVRHPSRYCYLVLLLCLQRSVRKERIRPACCVFPRGRGAAVLNAFCSTSQIVGSHAPYSVPHRLLRTLCCCYSSSIVVFEKPHDIIYASKTFRRLACYAKRRFSLFRGRNKHANT